MSFVSEGKKKIIDLKDTNEQSKIVVDLIGEELVAYEKIILCLKTTPSSRHGLARKSLAKFSDFG